MLTGTPPRILLWETDDERVLATVTAPGTDFIPVAMESRPGRQSGADVITPQEVSAVWSATHPDVTGPSTDVEIAAAAVGLGLVDGAVGGAATSSADVLRAALRYVGATGTVSLAMLADPPPGSPVGRPVMLADCAVVPLPTAEQLAHIALASAETWERVTGSPARVAFVAATTKAAEPSGDAECIAQALARVAASRPDLSVDGELQVDAALMPDVADRKLAPDQIGSERCVGAANVLIFPNLVAANAAYKLLQHLAGYTITPITQGLRRPFFDVSRGCSYQEFRSAAVQCAAVAGATPQMEVAQ